MPFSFMKPSFSLLALTFALMTAMGCTTSPRGNKQLALVPQEQLRAMGEQSFEQMKREMPQVQDPQVVSYVRCIVESVTKSMDAKGQPQSWEIVVFKNETANAFALPGGKIGVFTGMLEVADTSDQLASVIAHEIAHVVADHPNARVSEQLAAQGGLSLLGSILGEGGPRKQLLMSALGIGAQLGVILPHTRDQEREADLLGLEYMAKAGYDPKAAVELWREMQAKGGPQPPQFLATHPTYGSRIQYLQDHLQEVRSIASRAKASPTCSSPGTQAARR